VYSSAVGRTKLKIEMKKPGRQGKRRDMYLQRKKERHVKHGRAEQEQS